MKRNVIVPLCAAVLALSSVAVGPAAAQGRQGHGPHSGNPEQFIERRVQNLDKQVDLTDTQEQQVRQVLEESMREMQERVGTARDGQQADRDAHRAFMRSQMEETEQEILAVLTPEQQKRYQTVQAERRERMEQRRQNRQDRGERGRQRAEAFAKELNLSDVQQEQIRAIFAEQREAVRTWMSAHPDATRDERRAYMQEQFKAANAEVEALLTPEQREQYQAKRAELQKRRQERREDGKSGRNRGERRGGGQGYEHGHPQGSANGR